MFSVIVTIDNNYELANNFFETLLQTTDFTNGELIVVSDGCNNKNTLEYLHKLDLSNSYIKTFYFDEKLGVAKANNFGVNKSSYEDLVFINTDVLLNDRSIEKLVNYLNTSPKIGAVQGRLIYPQNNKIQSTGHTFEYCYNGHLYKGRNYDDPIVTKIAERQAITSAFYAMKKETFLRFGGFDEAYFNAYEGMELSLKIHKSGLKCMYYPDAIAYHITGGSRNSINYDNEYSGRIFWLKWGNSIEADLSNYIKEQLTEEVFSNTYYLIKCSGLNFWDKIINDLNLKISGSSSIKDRFTKSINLYNELTYEFLKIQTPLLFICNDMEELKGNNNWYYIRHNPSDLVIDAHGNVEKLAIITGNTLDE